MEIKTRKFFKEVVKKLTLEILDEEELDEMTVTGDVAGYNTPFAFTGKKGGKKKKKKIATNSTGFEVLDESIDDKDIKVIKKLVRDVVADILRDIWIKRTSWK